MIAQDFDADGVEGTQPGHALNHATDQMTDAFFHFARGFVGEGDGEDLVGPGFLRGENVGKPSCEYAGFASACTCENQQWPINAQHSFALFGV